MKKIVYLLVLSFLFIQCNSTQNTTASQEEIPDEPVVIENEELEYEVTIMDSGFNIYLQSIARPMGYYSEQFLEQRNRYYVSVWNQRARNPNQFDPEIYANEIAYDPNIHYGLEVNFKLYNYFKFVEYKYNQKFR